MMLGTLSQRFADLRAQRRPALVCYVTAGHPNVSRSVDLLRGLAAAGADAIEVGIPFSDPLADGPAIQASSQAALAQGMTFDRALAVIARADVAVPVIVFSYLNPLLAAGPDALRRAADAGASGVLVTDLPVGADPAREAWLGESPLAYIRLVAPTTPSDRMAEIARHGSGFVYLISRLGVTGARAHSLPSCRRRSAVSGRPPICPSAWDSASPVRSTPKRSLGSPMVSWSAAPSSRPRVATWAPPSIWR